MRRQNRKAARLVNSDAVTITYWRVAQDRIEYAAGTVQGDHGEYTVTIEPDRDCCDCQHGMTMPGRTHSHTTALRLAVWKIARSTNART
jgi:hypothetical protein